MMISHAPTSPARDLRRAAPPSPSVTPIERSAPVDFVADPVPSDSGRGWSGLALAGLALVGGLALTGCLEAEPTSSVATESQHEIGDHELRSDGVIGTRVGETTIIHSDGTITTEIGNTRIRSDGTVGTRIGNTIINNDGTITYELP